jgi:NADH:quinone reductase (non-electrogenic)
MSSRVVVIGGGFGGLFTVRGLRGAHVDVTVVDRTPHHLFQPLLYQVATGILSEGQIAVPLRDLMKRHRNVDCIAGDVTVVDATNRIVRAERPGGGRVDLPYDHLVVAAGVRQSYFGHDEFAEHAPGMKTLADALLIRRKLFGAFEMAQTASDPIERQRWLTFALVGAGPTGVELAGQIRELATHTLRREFRRIDPGEARVLLFDSGDTPLAPFGTKLAGKASTALSSLGVDLHMHSMVTAVDQDGLQVRDASGATTRYEAGTVLWTAGVAAAAVADVVTQACGAEQDRAGRIKVGPDLTLPGHPEISVVGDMMSLLELPGVAEVAMQTGYYAGRRIRALESGRTWTKPFDYHDLGSAAYISRGRAVVSFKGLHVSGKIGWAAWLGIHLMFLTSFRNRFGALISWALTFSREKRRERAFGLQVVVPGQDIYDAPRPERPRSDADPIPPTGPGQS